jgi:hypothetical protein
MEPMETARIAYSGMIERHDDKWIDVVVTLPADLLAEERRIPLAMVPEPERSRIKAGVRIEWTAELTALGETISEAHLGGP